MLIVCESYLYSLQICIRIWYNTITKIAIKCDIRCKIKQCNCRLLLRTTYYAPVAELAYAADSSSVFLRVQLPAGVPFFETDSGGNFVNAINVVTIGKLIEAHREGDEQKFKTYVDFIVKAYEEQENDRAARIIRSSYTGDYGEQGKVVLDEATEQTTYYETGWYEPDVLGSGGSYRGVTKATSEEEALQRLLKHSADYAHRITVYKKDGKTIKREISEYDQWEKRWLT